MYWRYVSISLPDHAPYGEWIPEQLLVSAENRYDDASRQYRLGFLEFQHKH